MNKYILYFFGLFIFFSPLVAQTTFSLAIDNNENSETAVSIIQLEDGSFVIASLCLINPTWKDCMQLMKTDSLGNVIWNKQYDHRKPGYRGTLEPTQDGGFTLGTWWYAAPGEPEDVFLLKFDSEGDTMWTRQFGGAGRDIGWDTAELLDGSLVVVGRTESFGNGEEDIYVIKTDAQGKFQWEKTFGGAGRDVSAYISIDNDNQIFLSGLTSDTPTQNTATIVLKLDTMGNEIFRKTLLYTPGKDHCGAYIFPGLEKGYIMHGCMDTIINEGEYDLPHYVGKLDAEANIEWMTFFNEAREKWVANIYEMSDGHIMVVGIDKNHPETAVNDNSGFLAKLSPQGEILWQRNYQGLDNSWQIQDMCLTLDGGFALVGRYRNIIDEPDNEGDVWLMKVDSMGCLEPGCGSDLIRVPSHFVYTDIEEVPAPVLGVFSIYPNPSTHSTIAYFEEKADRLLIQDITGKIVFDTVVEKDQAKVFINTSTFENGIYIVSLSWQGKPKAKNKLVVLH